jgi:uncharacterized membrane protein YhhN
MISTIILSIFTIFSLTHIIGESFKSLKVRYTTKPFLLITLGLYYFFSVEQVNLWLISAIALGWLGDIFLMLPDPDNSKKYLRPGIAAFLLGHIFYILVFILKINTLSQFPLYGYLIMVPFIILGFIAWKMIIPHAGNMAGAVTAYVIIIVIMGICATMTLGIGKLTGVTMVITGAFIFLISDSMDIINLRKQFPMNEYTP